MNGILEAIFNNPKTTITALVGTIAYLLAVFGINIDAQTQLHFVMALLFIYGLFAKDGDSSK